MGDDRCESRFEAVTVKALKEDVQAVVRVVNDVCADLRIQARDRPAQLGVYTACRCIAAVGDVIKSPVVWC
ncbi:hypothetical protein [Streptomyces virginiae]|uniref:hypothetical protein n=1 Tax=Streptomyces virginiae TaxID=1961 RepID=UPI002DD9A8D3|nr:hypothetical protein [Streptomyces virginiae]WSC75509.1 hypothetical protein OHA56_03810 [Streptomyces virginiae]